MKYDYERMLKAAQERGEPSSSIYISKKEQKMGSIILSLNDPTKVDFETFNLTNNNKRHQPSLELLDDVKKVAQLLRKAIKENWKNN